MKCFKLVETQVAEDELIFSLTSTGKVQKEVQSDKGQQGSEFSFLPCELTATFTNTAETEVAVPSLLCCGESVQRWRGASRPPVS